ncbi:conserved hypothetical protein [uncultured Dysgonomonas sp.]|uniref:Glycosyltransferase 2-like domain-containing protein n=1 Tax=uncultured Dysgonomonas sp. TaxID=206096 RepID=A0A212K8J5_9BACT|nr:glycosyltransferase family 2 protein [uncultured Dysgonomonas sp.]SBW08034.1 conserved hypothetical protein [uncultured Dysgonomonas sp.]
MQINKTKISIITVSFNTSDVIEKTIQSVINQIYPNIEYIIIDGGSTDGTADIIRKYANKITFWISEPDKGIYDAMNKGIDKANGEWINFMNAGDYFANNNVLTEIFNGNSYDHSIGVIYGDSIGVKEGNVYVYEKPVPFFKQKNYIQSKGISHQSMFVNSFIAKEIKFDLNLLICADFDMAYKIFNLGKKYHYIGIPIAYFESGGISTTRTKQAFYENAVITGVQNTIKFKLIKIVKFIELDIRKVTINLLKKVSPYLLKSIRKKIYNTN